MSNLPPQSLETEESILADCMLYHDSLLVAMDHITPDDFYSPKHAKIFSACCELETAGNPVDIITVTDQLRKNGDLAKVGGPVELAKLVDCCPVPANIREYCGIVKDKATLRAVISEAIKIIRSCYEKPGPAIDVLDAAQQALGNVHRENSADAVCVKDLVPGQIDRYEQLHKSGEAITGIRTGFQDLDRMTSGLQPTDLIILAGRPSMGKSAFMSCVSKNIGGQGIPGAVFSLEMSRSQLMDRLFSDIGRINLMKFRNGNFGNEEWGNVARAAGIITSMPIYIDDTAETHYRQIRRKARRLRREKGIRWIVIDYLQLMQGDGGRNREREVSEITRNLKLMAKELEIPVICLSQLNRGCEQRDNKRPKLSDLRESGAIEQDADIVWFLYRDEVYYPDAGNEGQAELIVAKQRNGPIGLIGLEWDKRTATFRDRRL